VVASSGLTAAPALAADSTTDSFVQWEDAKVLTASTTEGNPGSMYWVTNRSTGAGAYWRSGITGAGIDIALIDTGVTPVDGLTYKGKVINGPDLSFDSQSDDLRHLDAYGHGTHMAGIIAGRADGARTVAAWNDDHFLGMAPGARIVNVKVADAVGAVDVSQVIAGIDWVIQHRRDNGMNIRVITLAYGTNSIQSYEIDPLAHAVERAWESGIVVVTAAGNDGNGSALRNPASDPFVIAVGASEAAGRATVADDRVAEFSNCGTSRRYVDVVAPGKSIVSLRNPGSVADVMNPEARVDADLFLGSGTSQAAAVVSGAVALVLEQRPELTPNQVKQLLAEDTARYLYNAKSYCQGGGIINLWSARTAETPNEKASWQGYQHSNGTGAIEDARGKMHVYRSANGTGSDAKMIPLTGEVDILGNPWKGYTCKSAVTCQSLWDGGMFNGASWSGASWSGASWSGASWSGASWSGASWSGASWSSMTWSGASWSGASWSGASWSGASWSGASWSNDAWSAEAWS